MDGVDLSPQGLRVLQLLQLKGRLCVRKDRRRLRRPRNLMVKESLQ